MGVRLFNYVDIKGKEEPSYPLNKEVNPLTNPSSEEGNSQVEIV